MKGIILAAGRGSRMKKLTDHKPKGLIELHGKTLIDRQIEAFNLAGIKDISVVTGYKSELIAGLSLKEFHNRFWQKTNMVFSLQRASSWLEEDPCVVTYSDIFFETSAVSLLIESDTDLALTYDKNWLKLWRKRFKDPLSDAESFALRDGFLIDIGRKPKNISEVEGQYMGLLKFTPISWKELNLAIAKLPIKEKMEIDMTSALRHIIFRDKLKIGAIPYTGTWGEVDSETDLRIYN